MAFISDHTVRVLDQEIDTVVICPTNTDYVIVGTYSLVKEAQQPLATASSAEDETPLQDTKTTRIGSLQILPINPVSGNDLEDPSPSFPRYDMPCAILDIRFCPTDDSLLGAATSIGELRFFRITGLSDIRGAAVNMVRIVPLGIAQIHHNPANLGTESPTPLVTQFAWIEQRTYTEARLRIDAGLVYQLAVCDTTGRARIVQVALPPKYSEEGADNRVGVNDIISAVTTTIHKHLYDLEAWTVADMELLNAYKADTNHILFSGGDDSCIIASAYSLKSEPTFDHAGEVLDGQSSILSSRCVQIDKRSHTAGVVSILPLLSDTVLNANEERSTKIPIVTGSYDQELRLLLFDQERQKFQVVSQFQLEGGVWRIFFLDAYEVTDKTNLRQCHHYILLVSAMHAGCYVIRLVNQPFDTAGNPLGWSWTVEARFQGSHKSMVYSCAAQRASKNDQKVGKWTIVSTSFYDKRICVWEWNDGFYSATP